MMTETVDGNINHDSRLSNHDDLTATNWNAVSSGSSPPSGYYVLFRPPDLDQINDGNSIPNDVISIFNDKREVLTAMKTFRGARFKAFRTHEEALEFSRLPAENCHIPTTPDLESGTTFHGPTTKELQKLRKAIESGDAEFVRHTVRANPRYLVSSGDTPTILQVGTRYNALHVAAISKQAAIGEIVLNTIEDPTFMKLLYNDDSPSTTLKRIDFLVDLYLNMPDKASNDTPLHFASRFGCLRMVQMLVSHPACDKYIRNKYKETARDVICARCSSDEMRCQIADALKDRYYVPVLAMEDGSQQPYVGNPWSPHKLPDSRSPLAQSPFVRAYAGPMSPRRAEEFHHKFKNPPYSKCSTPSQYRRMRLMGIRISDTDKGLERIGRELARDLDIPWLEYWTFLGTFCDLSKADGLNLLETYLRNKYNEMSSNARYEASPSVSIVDSCMADYADYSSVFEDETTSNKITHEVCERTAQCSAYGKPPLSFRRKFIEMIKMGIECLFRVVRPCSLFSTDDCATIRGAHIGIAANSDKRKQDKREDFLEDNFVDLKWSVAREGAAMSSDEESKAQYHGYTTTKNSTINARVPQQLPCNPNTVVAISKEESTNLECLCKTAASVCEKDKKQDRIIELKDHRDPDDVFPNDSTSLETYYKPPISVISSHNSSLSTARTPDKGIAVFINGAEPAKLDLDVLRALEGVDVDPILYPNTCRWQHLINAYPKEEAERSVADSTSEAPTLIHQFVDSIASFRKASDQVCDRR